MTRQSKTALPVRRYRQRLWRHAVLLAYAAGTACLLAALFFASQPTPIQETIILQDVSGSVTATGTTPLPSYLERMIRESQRVHRLNFAGHAQPATPGSRYAGLDETQTDLAAALAAATALPAPVPVRRRILLLSDGRATRGDTLRAAQAAGHHGIVETIALGSRPRPDCRADSLVPRIPTAFAAPDMPFACVLTAIASDALSATVILTSDRDGVLLQTTVPLSASLNRIPLAPVLRTPGLHRLTARLQTARDLVPENDTVALAVTVQKNAPVLWITNAPATNTRPDGTPILTRTPDRFPVSAPLPYSLVVLETIAADALPGGAVSRLQEHVRDGGGLLVLGGDLAQLAYDQPRGDDPALESLLPVTAVPLDSLAIAFALDASGSMGETVQSSTGPTTKLTLAASAVLEAWQQLAPGDAASLVAFTAKAEVYIPFQKIDRPRSAATQRQRLARLTPSGGTSIFAGITEALASLTTARAHHRRILLITDGDTSEKEDALQAAIESTQKRLSEQNVHLTIIVVGDEPDRATLATLQQTLGATLIYASQRLLLLPSIVNSQARQERGVLRTNGNIRQITPHPFTTSLSANQLPAVKSYWQFGPLKEKQGAQALIETTDGDVLLAAWQPALGRVAVVSDTAWASWTTATDATRTLQTRLLQWLAARNTNRCTATVHADRVSVRYHTPRTPSPASTQPYRARLRSLAAPANTAAEAPPLSFSLSLNEPGTWQGSAPMPRPGLWRVDVLAPGTSRTARASCPLLIEDNAEWKSFGPDGHALAAIALAGNGQFVQSYEQFTPWERIPVTGSKPSSGLPTALVFAGITLLLLGLLLAALR